jgi:ankyrin repeat protein
LRTLLGNPTIKQRLKIVLTSRSHILVAFHFPDVTEIQLTAENLKTDIEAFIEDEVEQQFSGNQGMRDKIRQTLIKGANGMFLWVSLILEGFRTARSTKPRDITERLKNLPQGLSAIYLKILEDIRPDERETARSILQWVTCALRPLTIEELRIAIAIRPGATSLSTIEDDMEMDLRHVLRLMFGPMLKIQSDNTVHLVHQSAKDFLLGGEGSHHSGFFLFEPECNANLFLSCLTYLSFDECEVGPVGEHLQHLRKEFEEQVQKRQKEIQFLNYAAVHWPKHINQAVPEMHVPDGLCHAFLKFANSPQKFNLAYQVYCVYKNARFCRTEPLQIAACLGSILLIAILLEDGANVNTQGGQYGNPLQAASFHGHEAAAQLFIEIGADVNAQGGQYGNALQAASVSENEAVVRLLIENGADVNAQGGKYGNALQAASISENEAVVRLLIECGADVNAQGGQYGNALQAASVSENEAVVRLLIENGADVNAQGGKYGNSLQAASFCECEAVVRLLIECGADVNAQGAVFGNSLLAASVWENEAVVRLLIENGADVNAQGGELGNALQAASFCGHEAVVRLLIERGADVNAQGGFFGNALQAASSDGHEAVVRLLIERGADVNAQGGRFGNALQAASFYGHETVVRLLIEKGADVNAQGGEYEDALQAASSEGHETVIQLLIENGADVNMPGGVLQGALGADLVMENAGESRE